MAKAGRLAAAYVGRGVDRAVWPALGRCEPVDARRPAPVVRGNVRARRGRGAGPRFVGLPEFAGCGGRYALKVARGGRGRAVVGPLPCRGRAVVGASGGRGRAVVGACGARASPGAARRRGARRAAGRTAGRRIAGGTVATAKGRAAPFQLIASARPRAPRFPSTRARAGGTAAIASRGHLTLIDPGASGWNRRRRGRASRFGVFVENPARRVAAAILRSRQNCLRRLRSAAAFPAAVRARRLRPRSRSGRRPRGAAGTTSRFAKGATPRSRRPHGAAGSPTAAAGSLRRSSCRPRAPPRRLPLRRFTQPLRFRAAGGLDQIDPVGRQQKAPQAGRGGCRFARSRRAAGRPRRL